MPRKPKPRGTRLFRAIAGLRDKTIVRLDGWVNSQTGFGTSRDKSTYSHYQPFTPLEDDALSSLYHGSDVAGRIVDARPNEVYREGFSVDIGDIETNRWLADEFDRLVTVKHLQDGMRWGSCYGGSAVIVGADDGGRASAPLNMEKVRAVNYLYVTDRRFIVPFSYYTQPGHPKLGQPESYRVTPNSATRVELADIVHESRLIIYRGAKTGELERSMLNSWDYSILQKPHDAMRAFGVSWNAIEVMLAEANQTVFKSSGLADALAAEKEAPGALQSFIKARFQAMDMARSVIRAIVIDAGSEGKDGGDPAETFEKHATSFAGVSDVLQMVCLRMASSVPMPYTLFMGQSPAGMNATGRSDLEWWYALSQNVRTTDETPRIRWLTKLLLSQKSSPMRGKKIDNVLVNWPPLAGLSALEESTRRTNIATMDNTYIQAGVYLPEEVALTRSLPDGFDRDIALTPEGVKAREAVIKYELERMAEPPPEPPDPADPNAPPALPPGKTEDDAAPPPPSPEA